MLKLLHAFSESNPSPADIAQSLLFFFSKDIGQLACLQAKLHNINRIYFGGFFIRGHPLTMHSISHAIKYWSQGCYLLHHLRIFRFTNIYLLFKNCLDSLVLGNRVNGKSFNVDHINGCGCTILLAFPVIWSIRIFGFS